MAPRGISMPAANAWGDSRVCRRNQSTSSAKLLPLCSTHRSPTILAWLSIRHTRCFSLPQWQARLQMRRRRRTWPQVLSVGKLSRPAATNGLRAAGELRTDRRVYRQLPPESRDFGDDLRCQSRIAAPSRGALKRHHERVTVCRLRPEGCGIGWCTSRQHARRLAQRRPGEFIFCGASR